MKFINFNELTQLVELFERDNGKTHEALKEAINILLNADGDSSVIFVTYTNFSKREIFKVAQDLLKKVLSQAKVEIINSEQSQITFNSFSGKKRLIICGFNDDIFELCRGQKFDDAIFDVEPATLFAKSGTFNDSKISEFYVNLSPCINTPRRQIDMCTHEFHAE